MLDLVEGGQRLGRNRDAGQGDRGGRRQHHQYRHRLARGAHPDHRHLGAARAPSPGSPQAASAKCRIPLIATNRINMPEVAERILADGDADMVSMARPLLADPDWVDKAARRPRATASTPASPATRPASTTSSRTSAPAAWSIRAPATRPSSTITPATHAQAHRRGRRGPGGPGLRQHAGRARPRGDPVRRGRRDRRPVQLRQAHPGQGRVPRDAALFPPPARRHRRDAAAGQARRRCRTAGGGFDEVVLATGITPRNVDFPGSDDPRGAELYRRAGRAIIRSARQVAIIGAGGIGFDVAEFLVEDAPSPTTDVDALEARMGRRHATSTHRGGLQPRQCPSRPRARSGCCSAVRRTPRRAAGQDHRLGPSRHAEGQAACSMLGGVSYERFDDAGPAHRGRRQAADCCRSITWWSAPARNRNRAAARCAASRRA